MTKDPVCKMEVDEKESKFITTYKGRNYYFCSKACKEKFDNSVSSLKKAGGGICFGVRVEDEKEAMK